MKFSLVVSRTSDSETPYRVAITDEDSRVKLDLTLTAEQFAEAFTGLRSGGIEGRLLGDPSNIGKTKVREDRSIVLSFRDKEKVKQYLEAHHQEDGWYLDLHLGSQNSIISDGKGGYKVNYSVYKWE